MWQRTINDNFWEDPFVFNLDMEGKLLYQYCIYNPNQRPHGIFIANSSDITLYTHIEESHIEPQLKHFEDMGKIKRIPREHKIWTKDLPTIYSQTNSVKHILACLADESSSIIKQYVFYYAKLGFWKKHGLSLQYIPHYLSMSKQERSKWFRDSWHRWAKKEYPKLNACSLCGDTPTPEATLARHCIDHDYSRRDNCVILCGSCHAQVILSPQHFHDTLVALVIRDRMSGEV